MTGGSGMKLSAGIKTLFVCIAFGIAIFFCLIYVAKKATGSYETVKLTVTICDVPKNTEITKDNVGTYFALEEVNINMKTEASVQNLNDLIGLYPNENIEKRQLVSKTKFASEEAIESSYQNPDIASFQVSSFSDAAAGIIRRGDRINIYAYDTQTKESIVVLADAYVADAFNSSGEKIKPGDEEAVAVSFNILIEKDDEADFYQQISDQTLFATKIDASTPGNQNTDTTVTADESENSK